MLIEKTSKLLRKRQTTSFIVSLRKMQRTEEIGVHQNSRWPLAMQASLPLLEQRRTAGMPVLAGTLDHAGVLSVTDPSHYSKRQRTKRRSQRLQARPW